MPVPDIEKIIRDDLKKLNRLKDRELPIKVGRAVVESTRQNFRDGGFYGRKWKDTKRQQVGFYGVAGQNGPLNSGNDHLMSSTNCIPGKGKVTIFNPLEYAEIHNNGGQIPVTVKMKRFFWRKHYEIGKVSGSAKTRQKADAFAGEAGFWKGMALKKVGSKIKIPKRQFIGEDPQVDKIVDDIINKELQNYINGINHRRPR